MKKCILSILLILGLVSLHAQPCPNGAAAAYDLHANDILARIQAGGSLFTDFNEGYFLPDPEDGAPNPSTLFAAHLWMGGIDPGGNLKIYTGTYNAAVPAGPVVLDGGIPSPEDCSDWDRVFRVKGADIAAFLADLPGNPSEAILQYPDIMGWPGRGNPYFFDVHGFNLPEASNNLAPFWDTDGNAIYDPLMGDYPIVALVGKEPFVPDEIVWVVHNTIGASDLPLEVQLTAWAFNCPDQPVLNHTIFTSHKIIHFGVESVDSFYVGMWADFDIGCYTDDYLGTAPDLDAFFAYNRDALDGDPGTSCPGGIPTFGQSPPVQSAIFLNKSLDKSIYYNNSAINNPPPGTVDPAVDIQYYRLLSGIWPDGTPLTYGGSGYNPGNPTGVDHFCPDDPANTQGWSMCSAILPENDRRVVGSNYEGAFLPGQITELVLAWVHHPDPDLPCGLGDTYEQIGEVKDLYENDFEGVCSPLSGVKEVIEAGGFDVFPNPASGLVTIDAGERRVRSMAVFRTDGAQVMQGVYDQAVVPLDVSGWVPGVYLVRLTTGSEVMVQKLIVQ